MRSEAIEVALHKQLLSEAQEVVDVLQDVCSPTKTIGSSNCLNLHARFTARIYANGETVSYAADFTPEKKDEENECSEINDSIGDSDTSNDSQPTNEKPVSHRGEHKQHGLTSYAKRSIRVLAHHFQQEIDKEGSIKRSTSFQSLSFRRILPEDDREAKLIKRSYLERIRRNRGNIHYVWVAEKQDGKILKNGEQSYRMKHGQSVTHFHILSDEFFHWKWINTNWNETVANRYLKTGKIDAMQYQQWMNELDEHNKYCERLERFNNNERTTRPKAPSKSEFLLTPNVISPYNASAYMSKYMSKEGGKIPGHLWGMSYKSKPIVKPELVNLYFEDSYAANSFAVIFHNLMKANKSHRDNGSLLNSWHDFNTNMGIWSTDVELFNDCFIAAIGRAKGVHIGLPTPPPYSWRIP